MAADNESSNEVRSSVQESDPTYCNFPHRCGVPQDAVTPISMASNVAAMDLVKQPYQVIISWQALELKMKKYYGIKHQNSNPLRMSEGNLFT
jgi:hypothetical protein